MTTRLLPQVTSVVLAIAALLDAGDLALAQVEPYSAGTPDPGDGYLGNGAAGIPGPPAAPPRVTRPAGWPGSPEVDAAAQRAQIASPRPIGFAGLPTPPADLSMYKQRLNERPQTAPPMQSSPGQRPGADYPLGRSAVQPPRPPAGPPPLAGNVPGASQRATFNSVGEGAMAIALPGAGAVEIDGATVVAQVNGESVLAAELLPSVNWMLAKNGARLKKEEIPLARQYLLQQRLDSVVMLKLLSGAARRKIPAKGLEQFEKKMGDYFYQDEMPGLMKEYGCETRAQLEIKLRELGSSVERERKFWMEKVLAQQWLSSQLKEEKEVTHIDLLAYYQENVNEFQFPSRARWEQLSVNFGMRFSKAEARQRIAWMGDQVLGGKPFAEVAKAYSDGLTAPQGGYRDWTTRGSLASTVLDEALFNLPVGQMSPILEDENGLHIVRVVERYDAGQTPFFEAQDDIKKALVKDDKQEEREKYMKDLREKATVWTIFDGRNSTRLSAAPQSGPR